MKNAHCYSEWIVQIVGYEIAVFKIPNFWLSLGKMTSTLHTPLALPKLYGFEKCKNELMSDNNMDFISSLTRPLPLFFNYGTVNILKRIRIRIDIHGSDWSGSKTLLRIPVPE